MAVTEDRYSTGGSMELRDYVSLFSRRKWIIFIAIVIVTASALAASFVQSPVYQANSRLVLEPSATVFGPSQQISPVRIQTEIQVIQSRAVRDAVLEKLGDAPPVSAVQLASTEAIEVSVKASTPKLAANYANAYVEAYVEARRKLAASDLVAKATEIQRVIDDLNKQITDLDRVAAAAGEGRPQNTQAGPLSNPERDALVTNRAVFKQKLDELSVDSGLKNGNAYVLTEAAAPTDPVSPRPIRSGLLGLGLGLIVGIAVAMVVEHLDDSIKTKEDLEHAAPGLAVVGMIPFVPSWRNRSETRVISQVEPNSPAAEAYRSLRTSINFLGVDRTMRVVQITSPNASEGKTATTANLAVALARAGEQVVIVNCDLRRPRIHTFFGLSPATGFTNALLGELPLAEALQSVPGERNLRLLAAGKLPPNPSELLSSGRTKQLLDALRAQGAMVLIDCPPILPVTDAAVLSSRVDATIMVALAGSTTSKDLARALELLHQVNAPIIGTVLNGVSGGESGYGYQYGYSIDSPKVTKEKAFKRRKAPDDRAALKVATNGRSFSPPTATGARAIPPENAERPPRVIEGSRGRTDGRPGAAPIG